MMVTKLVAKLEYHLRKYGDTEVICDGLGEDVDIISMQTTSGLDALRAKRVFVLMLMRGRSDQPITPPASSARPAD